MLGFLSPLCEDCFLLVEVLGPLDLDCVAQCLLIAHLLRLAARTTCGDLGASSFKDDNTAQNNGVQLFAEMHILVECIMEYWCQKIQ